jgi:hypothetical protein
MSDYEVTLVNNKMSEFYVKFKGPAESECAGTRGLRVPRESGRVKLGVKRPGPAGPPPDIRSRDCDVISQGCGAIGAAMSPSTPPMRPPAPNQS